MLLGGNIRHAHDFAWSTTRIAWGKVKRTIQIQKREGGKGERECAMSVELRKGRIFIVFETKSAWHMSSAEDGYSRGKEWQ